MIRRVAWPVLPRMVVALLHVVAVLLAGTGFLAYRAHRRRRPADRPSRRSRRVSPVALEGAATAIGIVAIITAVAMKVW